MGLSQTQQIYTAIEKANHILIAFKQNYSGDTYSSALALIKTLKKMDKKVDIFCQSFELNKNLKFLNGSEYVLKEITGLKRFIISMDVSKGKISNFSYEIKNDLLKIYLTPKEGSIDPKNIKLRSTEYKYDLIITLDTEDLTSLGEGFEKNSDFFFNTPIINIDHNPANENYGQINLIDINATSTAEIIFKLLLAKDKNLIDDKIATAILTGVISKTKSFKTPQVTPKTLHMASELINYGADRDSIIKNLYYTKSISTLKLWGKVLSRLKYNDKYKMVWSFIPKADFEELGINDYNFNDLIDELIINAPDAQIIVLFYQTDSTKVNGLIYTTNNHNSLYLTKLFSPQGTKMLAKFTIDKPGLTDTGKEVLEEIKKKIII